MKKSLSIILLSLLFVACGGNHRYTALMQQADSLLTADKATAAYRLLAAADTQKTAWHRSQRMAYELLKAEAQNKAYIDFKTDSILRPVAQYYDSHGTSNQRLRAHYILGCAYRDMKEAPLAIITWETAIDCADTTAADCDYATLFRVYGQMADVYNRQNMPEKELKATKMYSIYAKRAGDIYEYIRGIELQVNAYYILRDSAGLLRATRHANELYIENGMKSNAAQVLAAAIHYYVNRKDWTKAQRLMNRYETESGLFNQEGDIIHSREQYYYYKGMYYLGTRNRDSSEIMFRKLLSVNDNLLDAYRGLFSLYQDRNMADSAIKYARLFEYTLMRYLDETQAQAVEQAEGMYNYNRQMKMAQRERKKARRANRWIIAMTICTILGIGIFAVTQKRKHRRKLQKIARLMNSYTELKAQVKEAEEELSVLRKEQSASKEMQLLLAKKEKASIEQEKRIIELEKQISKQKAEDMINALRDSDIVRYFRSQSTASRKSAEKERDKLVTKQNSICDKWRALEDEFRLHMPRFYALIKERNTLTEQESHVALLTRLDFGTKEIAIILGTQPSRVSTVKEQLNKKLFGQMGSRGLLYNMKQSEKI